MTNFYFVNIISHSFVSRHGSISDDPNEHNDVSEKYPDVVDKIKAKLEEYKKDYVPPNKPPPDKKSNPANFGGFWSPGWC